MTELIAELREKYPGTICPLNQIGGGGGRVNPDNTAVGITVTTNFDQVLTEFGGFNNRLSHYTLDRYNARCNQRRVSMYSTWYLDRYHTPRILLSILSVTTYN